jgi:hypothetical protein
LDDELWGRLAAVIAAANRGELNTMVRLFYQFDEGLSESMRCETRQYVWYVLRYSVAEAVGHRPTADDLHELAVRVYPQYARVLDVPVMTLEDTFRIFFRMPQLGDRLAGSRLIVASVAAVGVLLDDPVKALAKIRPSLAAWLRRGVGNTRILFKVEH